MRGTILALAALAVAAAGAGVAYQAASRQRDYRTLVARGDAALRDDQTFAAIEAYSGAIALRHDSMLAYLRRGETYRKRADRGDLEAAARDFRHASSLDPSAIRPLEELGDVRYQLHQYDRAIDAYERSARLDDRSARVAYKLALAEYRQGDVGAALAALDETVRLDERFPDAYYLMGVCLRDSRRPADAVKALERAIALSPALVPAREELADLYGELDRRSDELDQLQVLAGLDRPNVERQAAVGLAHARARRFDAAVLALSAALERRPDDPVLYGAIGQVWLESALARHDRVDLRKAREALERVALSSGATSEQMMLTGRAALEDGDVDAAERALFQATQRLPLVPDALLLYAAVAERQNHADGARRALIQYTALVSDDDDFAAHAAKIARLSMRLNDRDTAAVWSERAREADPHSAVESASFARPKPRATP